MSIHLVFVLSGMASFFLAFVSAVLYLVKERALKRRLPSAVSKRLSSLETLDSVTSTCMLAGVALLTFGIVSGMLLNHAAHEMIWRWSAHELTALAPWAVLVVLLIVRATAGWRGRRTAMLNVFGFTLTVASLAIGLAGRA
jgi:ABC-type transport system involved in cytochrome c biogenesis permease subunit